MAIKKQDVVVDESPINEDTTVQPNHTVTSEQFTNSKMLDMLALNNELNSLNKGELTFEVVKKDNYVFDKTDKNNNPIPLLNEDGSAVVDEDGIIQNEQMKSPYVEIAGKGISLTLSTKSISKDILESLTQGTTYVGTYLMSINDKGHPLMKFVSVVSINDELMSRMNAQGMGN